MNLFVSRKERAGDRKAVRPAQADDGASPGARRGRKGDDGVFGVDVHGDIAGASGSESVSRNGSRSALDPAGPLAEREAYLRASLSQRALQSLTRWTVASPLPLGPLGFSLAVLPAPPRPLPVGGADPVWRFGNSLRSANPHRLLAMK